ncbi:hypothetical protein [Marinobacter psychrophilus]|nr:hypothetical protein [Marinobacter psychrophilus]
MASSLFRSNSFGIHIGSLAIVIPEPASGVNLNFFFMPEKGACLATIFEVIHPQRSQLNHFPYRISSLKAGNVKQEVSITMPLENIAKFVQACPPLSLKVCLARRVAKLLIPSSTAKISRLMRSCSTEKLLVLTPASDKLVCKPFSWTCLFCRA